MKNFKAAANSCQRTRTRKWSVELDSYDLYYAVQWLLNRLGLTYDQGEARWQELWQEIKKQPSYTVRVNGRRTIVRGRVVSKTTRLRMKRRESRPHV